MCPFVPGRVVRDAPSPCTVRAAAAHRWPRRRSPIRRHLAPHGACPDRTSRPSRWGCRRPGWRPAERRRWSVHDAIRSWPARTHPPCRRCPRTATSSRGRPGATLEPVAVHARTATDRTLGQRAGAGVVEGRDGMFGRDVCTVDVMKVAIPRLGHQGQQPLRGDEWMMIGDPLHRAVMAGPDSVGARHAESAGRASPTPRPRSGRSSHRCRSSSTSRPRMRRRRPSCPSEEWR